MTTRTIVALAAATSLLMLSACGGGGGGGSPSTSMPPSAPTVASVQSGNPDLTRGAASRVADNLPAFGSVTQSSNGGSVSGITTDAASTTFDC